MYEDGRELEEAGIGMVERKRRQRKWGGGGRTVSGGKEENGRRDRDDSEKEEVRDGSSEAEEKERGGGSELPFLLSVRLLCSASTMRRRFSSWRAGPMGAWTCAALLLCGCFLSVEVQG